MDKAALLENLIIVSEADYLATYQHPGHYQAKNSSRFLGQKGLLPLRYGSPLFPQLNILLSACLWSGSISKGSGEGVRRHGQFMMGAHLDVPTLESITDATSGLEIDFGPIPGRDNNFYVSDNGAAYARLASKIPGVPVSGGTKEHPERKGSHKKIIPDYIWFLADRYRWLTGKDKDIARKILTDFINVLFQTKMGVDSGSYFLIPLFKTETKEEGEEFGKKIVKLISAVYPRIGLSENSVRSSRWGKGRTSSQTRICFPEEMVWAATKHYGLFDISLNRDFLPLGKKLSTKKRSPNK
ncbi:hypothetical protein HYU14_06725 [Candidatus Woesearchaeota archaeon]|nr:hypothetical protein [Candidatus Woesearchaeota archaeon]